MWHFDAAALTSATFALHDARDVSEAVERVRAVTWHAAADSHSAELGGLDPDDLVAPAAGFEHLLGAHFSGI